MAGDKEEPTQGPGGWGGRPLTADDAVRFWEFMRNWEEALAGWEPRGYEAILNLRHGGATWRWIGAALGITPQAAQQRFKRYEEAYEGFIDEMVRRREVGEDGESSEVSGNQGATAYYEWLCEER